MERTMPEIRSRLVKHIYQLVAAGLIIGMLGGAVSAQMPPGLHDLHETDVCNTPKFIGHAIETFNSWPRPVISLQVAGMQVQLPNPTIIDITDIEQSPFVPDTAGGNTSRSCIGTLVWSNGNHQREIWGYYLNSAGSAIYYHQPSD
jgi:hypothetical protein